jgi:hypothetical protein
MLGFGDLGVAAAYVLCLASTALCVVYALLHWNDEEVMPAAKHPPNEDLSVDEDI